MTHEGKVEISKSGTVARCSVCKKALLYRTGMNVNMFNSMMISFIAKHRDCKDKKETIQ